MGDVGSEQLETAPQDHRRRHAIDVVVAVYGDALAAGDGAKDPVDGRRHVSQSEWVVQVVERGGEKAPGEIGVVDATNAQEPGGDSTDAELVGETVDSRLVAAARLPDALNGRTATVGSARRPRLVACRLVFGVLELGWFQPRLCMSSHPMRQRLGAVRCCSTRAQIDSLAWSRSAASTSSAKCR